MRLLSRVVLASGVRDTIGELVAPLQFACGMRCGADAMSHAVRVLTERHPEWVWLAWDLANAFNSVSREAVLRALEGDERLRCLIPYFCLMHDEDGELWYRGERGRSVIWSAEGMAQGDPLSMLYFCLAIAPCLEEVSAVLPEDSAVLSFADDGRVGAPAAALLRLLEGAVSAFQRVGLRLQVGKSEVWAPGAESEEAVQEVADAFAERGHGLQACRSGGMVTVGCPLGQSGWAHRRLVCTVAQHSGFLRRTRAVAHRHPSQALRLLQICGVRRFQHHIRVADPVHTRGPARAADVMVERAFLEIAQPLGWGSSSWEEAEDGSRYGEHSLQRARQPAAFGGAGLTSMEEEVDSAAYASWGATLQPLIERFTGVRQSAALRDLAEELGRAETSDLPWAVGLRETQGRILAELDQDYLQGIRGLPADFLASVVPRASGVDTAGGRRGTRRRERDLPEAFDLPGVGDIVQEQGVYILIL